MYMFVVEQFISKEIQVEMSTDLMFIINVTGRPFNAIATISKIDKYAYYDF